jgi:hypothetical protein
MIPIHPSVAWMLAPDPTEFRLYRELYHPGNYLAWPHGKVTYMSKNKTRRLWLNIKAEGVNVSKQEFVRALMESIADETYQLPAGWNVTLEWRNKETAPMRSGPWTAEMQKSAKSSDGFDKAVTDWLKRKLR